MKKENILFMKNIAKKIVTDVFATNSKEIISIIEDKGYDVVSFDIFDTLIKRNVNKSSDVFGVLENEYRKYFKAEKPIAELRKQAESMVNIDSATLDDIYSVITSLSNSEKEWLKDREIYLETKLCQKNRNMYDVFTWCKKNNKKILIISDMYLSNSVIERILKNSGYRDWDSLYVSCEYSARKATGKLFDIVKQQENLNVKNWVHIGDAQKGDYISPKREGLNAILIRINEYNTEYYNKKYLLKERKENKYTYNIINSFIKNNEPYDYNYYEKLGYEVIGPILYGYSQWLQYSAKRMNINKLFFLAREGAFLKKAFEIVSDSSIKAHLIKVSRKATTIPLLHKTEDIEELLRLVNVSRRNFTVENLLDACGLNFEDKDRILKYTQIEKNELLERLSKESKDKLYKVSRDSIVENSRQQEEYIRGYLAEFNFSGNIGVCDVGWSGTIQRNLQEICPDTKVTGFYMGKKNKGIDNNGPAKAYLFDDERNSKIRSEIMSSPDIFELFFLSTDGTTIGYSEKNGKYYCIQAKPDQSVENAKEILKLQAAAIRFVEDFKKFRKNISICMDSNGYVAGYSRFINPPSLDTVKEFSNFSFLNVGTHSMVAEKNLLYYTVNPQKFIDEFLNNGSKSIFLRSIFKLPLPYANIIDFIRKFDKG